MTPIQTAIRSNLAVIAQGVNLLDHLSAEQYGQRIAICYNASIGGHVRHIIEHYQSFLVALVDGVLDYEKRARDPLVESNVSHARGILSAVADKLTELDGVLVNREVPFQSETTSGVLTGTSVLRELEFLLSHTIHHYALVAVMARLQGCEPEASFGIAPSTLKYQESQATACAR
jgi:uncharacterized damage-inducible protein DinB